MLRHLAKAASILLLYFADLLNFLFVLGEPPGIAMAQATKTL